MCTKNSQNDDTAPWQQWPFCSFSSLYRWITMIIDIRYIIGTLLCYIELFDLIRKSDLFVFYSDKAMTSGCMLGCWQLTTQEIFIWNALWYVLQWYHALTYIDNECRKYLMHCVLLYIKKLMVHLFEFLQCAFLFTTNWPHSYNATVLLNPHFRFLKGMICLRTLALLNFASYWLSVYAERIRDGGATFWYALLLILIWSRRHKTAVKDQTC
jgi:hypothetical protein